MHDVTLSDKIRVALADLIQAQPLLVSAITELEQQGYTTEAANLQIVLDNLITRTNEAKAAIV